MGGRLTAFNLGANTITSQARTYQALTQQAHISRTHTFMLNIPHSIQERYDDYSACGQYRYTLWHDDSGLLADDRYVLFLGARAGVADAKLLQTCAEMAAQWGFKSVCLANLSASLQGSGSAAGGATPVEEAAQINREMIECAAASASLVVAVWGEEGAGREAQVRQLLAGRHLHYVATTLDGQPCMPAPGHLPASAKVYGQWPSEAECQTFEVAPSA